MQMLAVAAAKIWILNLAKDQDIFTYQKIKVRFGSQKRPKTELCILLAIICLWSTPIELFDLSIAFDYPQNSNIILAAEAATVRVVNVASNNLFQHTFEND